MEEKRLFDILKMYIRKYPEQEVALARKENGSWKKYSVQEYIEITNYLSYAFIELGIKKDDKVAIISKGKLVFDGTIEEMKNKVGEDESLEKMFLELVDDE